MLAVAARQRVHAQHAQPNSTAARLASQDTPNTRQRSSAGSTAALVGEGPAPVEKEAAGQAERAAAGIRLRFGEPGPAHQRPGAASPTKVLAPHGQEAQYRHAQASGSRLTPDRSLDEERGRRFGLGGGPAQVFAEHADAQDLHSPRKYMGSTIEVQPGTASGVKNTPPAHVSPPCRRRRSRSRPRDSRSGTVENEGTASSASASMPAAGTSDLPARRGARVGLHSSR